MNSTVGFRQPMHELQRSRNDELLCVTFLERGLLDGLIQLIKEEGFTQSSHDRGGPVILKSHLTQFVQEGAFMVSGLGIKLRQCYKRRCLVDLYGMVTMDHSGPKLDRRDMSFSGRAQT